jgi:two-component system phosphate regulon response regulator PhoB
MAEQKTVLVVEDDRDIAVSTSLRLQAAGFNTLIAASAEEGLVLALERHPDVIVLDIRLPKMDGLTALRTLSMQDSTKDIPVVALSACVGHKLAALEQGARYFLRKPCDVGHLVDAVQSTVGRHAPSAGSPS